MSVDFPDHPFWDFSLDVYPCEGVGAACLALQGRHQVDVNALLFCLWLGASGRGTIGAGETEALLEAVGIWHREVVRGLRAVRTGMKDGIPPAPIALSDPLRRRILKIEVDCEHVEQLMLAGTVKRDADPAKPEPVRAADALANIGQFFAACAMVLDKDDRRHLATIVGAAFAGIETDRMAALCDALEPTAG